MSVALLIAENQRDLLACFAAVEQLPYAMLLDSAAPDHPNSQFDMLVCQPLAKLEAYGHACQVQFADQATPELRSGQDPFLLLKQLQQQLLPAVTTEQLPLPFYGGALGYVSYDAGRVIEQLPALALADIKLPDLAFGIYAWALVLDKQQQQLWYVDCRAANQAQASSYYQQVEPLFASALQQQPTTALPSFLLTSDWQSGISQRQYQQKFQQIQQYLQSGDCYQINLAQRFSAGYQGSEWQAYLALRAANAAPFSAFIRLEQGAVLSISPERFLLLNQRQVETKPIKGTKPRFADPVLDAQSAAALQQSAKDRAENVMIVDLLRNDLGKVCTPGTVRVPALFQIESFPAVHHLVSTVTGELASDYQAADLLRAAFPGGSITGAPKVRAMQIIEELEPCRRSVYCGAIGYLSQHGRMDSNIAIRTLVCQQGQIYCWAGGGIVADSKADSEYQETFDKVAKILPVLSALSAANHSNAAACAGSALTAEPALVSKAQAS